MNIINDRQLKHLVVSKKLSLKILVQKIYVLKQEHTQMEK